MMVTEEKQGASEAAGQEGSPRCSPRSHQCCRTAGTTGMGLGGLSALPCLSKCAEAAADPPRTGPQRLLAVLKTCLERQVGAGAVQAPSVGFPHLLLLAG